MQKNCDSYIKSAYQKARRIIFGILIAIYVLFFLCLFSVPDVSLYSVLYNLPFLFMFSVLSFAIYLMVCFVIKKNFEGIEVEMRDKNSLDYFRNCLDFPIALLGILYNYKITDSHVSAILLELEQKGNIDCSGNSVKINKKEDATLTVSEQVTLQALASSTSYREFKNILQKKLQHEAHRLGYLKLYDGSAPIICVVSCTIFILSVFIAHKCGIETGYTYLSSQVYYYVSRISFICGIVSLMFYRKRKKISYIKTKKGKEISYKLMSLENYIKDFGNLDDLPADALKYRGNFYLYSVLFGDNDDVTKEYCNKLKNTFM